MDVTPELREFLFRYDQGEPLKVQGVTTQDGGVVRERLSYASINGMRVPAVLTYAPQTTAPRPVLMVQHGLHSSKDDRRIADLATVWAGYGFAILTTDAPLHGERAAGADVDLMALLTHPYSGLRFVIQSVVDLRRAVDLIDSRPDLDAGRIAYVGFSMSTFLGVQFVALEPRVRAAIFALGGAGLFHVFAGRQSGAQKAAQETVASLVDPLHFAALIAPRAVLQVNSETDEVAPAALGHMLYGALQEPKRIIWYRAAHGDLSEPVLAEMRLFLEDALAVAGGEPLGSIR